MFAKEIVVDAKGHLLGRLSSYIAKQLLQGQKIVVVRCEKINISGSLFRNKVKFGQYLRKRLLTNPRRGFVHYRCPSRILWRCIRGMLPRKTARGAAALVFQGCPSPYDVKKKQVVPDALKINRLKNFRKFCFLGDLSSEVGWGKKDLVQKLQQKRKIRAKKWYEKKVVQLNRRRKMLNLPQVKKLKQMLAQYGY